MGARRSLRLKIVESCHTLPSVYGRLGVTLYMVPLSVSFAQNFPGFGRAGRSLQAASFLPSHVPQVEFGRRRHATVRVKKRQVSKSRMAKCFAHSDAGAGDRNRATERFPSELHGFARNCLRN